MEDDVNLLALYTLKHLLMQGLKENTSKEAAWAGLSVIKAALNDPYSFIKDLQDGKYDIKTNRA